jgi:hypothetical protein
LTFFIEEPRNLIHRRDLVATECQPVLQAAQVIGLDDLAFERSRRLHILEPQSLQIFLRWKALDAVRVALISALEVPKPMLAPVRENDEWRIQVFRVSARLLFCIVRIEVFALRFQNTDDLPEFPLQEVVGSPVGGVGLELNVSTAKQIPAAIFQRFINQNTRKCFVLAVSHIAARPPIKAIPILYP